MRKSRSGFTVIELIIVIVVIAILAMIVLVAYKNIQDRAKNSQTATAAVQWAKALEVYKVRNGGLPTVSSCLGDDYKYNSNGLGSTGIGQCRQENSTTGVTSQISFASALSPYLSSNPTPAMVTAQNSTTVWQRGLYYYYTAASNTARLDMVMLPASGCPDRLGDIPLTTTTTATNGNLLCSYSLGSTTGF